MGSSVDETAGSGQEIADAGHDPFCGPTVQILQPSLPRKLAKKFEELFTIDLRSLALFRIVVAVLTLFDLIFRFSDLEAFYTDRGVLSRDGLLSLDASKLDVSFHLMNGTFFFEAFLFFLAGLFALGMLVGYRTRLTTFLSWMMLVSLQARNPAILNGGDNVHRVLLFWCLFLPMGAKYSIDQALNLSFASRSKKIFSAGSVALLLQVAIIYIFVVLHKTGAEWFPEGSATYYALRNEQLRTPLGELVLAAGMPTLKGLTLATLGYQAVGPLLLFFPFFTQRIRLFALLGFVFMQMSFGFCLVLGLFPWIASAAMIPFIPSFVWTWLSGALEKRQKAVIVYYDRTIPVLRFMSRLLKIVLVLPRSSFRPWPVPAKNPGLVVDYKGNPHTGVSGIAVMMNASYLGRPFAILFTYILRIGKWILPDSVTAHQLSKQEFEFFKYRRDANQLSPWKNGVVIFLIIIVIGANIVTLDSVHSKMVGPLNYVRLFMRLNQTWNMFSPHPPLEDGWFVIKGIVMDGSEVSLFTPDSKLTWEKPAHIAKLYKNARWQKYMMNLAGTNYAGYRQFLAWYLCRQWNETRSLRMDRITEVEISFMQKTNLPDYQETIPQRLNLGRYACK